MVDFRKWLPAFAGLVLLTTGTQVFAQSANPFVCNASTAVPTLARGEGLTELTGDIVLQCQLQGVAGQPLPTSPSGIIANVQIFLNTNVTSRLLSGSNTEALLLLNEPTPANRILATSTTPVIVPTGANAFYGQYTSSLTNSITWLGVPVLAPGSNSSTIRITNVRADATTQVSANPLVPAQIVAYISISGSASVAVNNPQQTVAFVQKGLSGTVTGAGSFQQCINTNFPTSNTAGAPAVLSFKENFGTAFKERTFYTSRTRGLGTSYFAAGPPNAPIDPNNGGPGAIDQPILGFPYNTESGVVQQSVFGTATGTATSGTKLLATFANITPGVAIYGTTTPVAVSSPQSGTVTAGLSNYAVLTSTGDPTGVSGVAGATGLPVSGSGLFPGTLYGFETSALALSYVQVNPGNTATGSATWEVVGAFPAAIETFNFGVIISYQSQTSQNLPPITPSSGATAPTINLSLAPVYPTGTAGNNTVSSSLAIPRFAPNQTGGSFFGINSCATNLLFPFITTVTGFETGIAIANTSLDPFGTQNQTGYCTLNFYANNADVTPAGQQVAPATTPIIPAGSVYRFILSTGGASPTGLTAPTAGTGVAAPLAGVGPNFTGYLIAQCNFQYAHGFAFISKPGVVGTGAFAEGYLALIIPVRTRRPEPFSTGGAQTGETLGN